MQKYLLLAWALVGLSCASGTQVSGSLDYLKCPTDSSADTGSGDSDTGLFSSFSSANSYNCKSNTGVCQQVLGPSYMCDTVRGCCMSANQGRCSTTADCTTNTMAYCDTATSNCLACSSTNQQLGDQQCATWAAARMDPLNETKCISGQCLECRTSADCTRPMHLFCNMTTGICGGCIQNSDCPGSNICKTDQSLLATGDTVNNIGECVKASDVAWVDQTNCTAGGTGTQNSPYCEIATAVTNMKSYVNVVGGKGDGQLYMPVNVTTSGQRVVIFGPGRDTSPYMTKQAVINGVTVSNGAQVTLVDIAVANQAQLPAVQCSGSATLYVRRVLIADTMDVPRGGIYANNCTLVDIEKTKIHTVNGNGIFITGGTGHRIINNAIINGLKNPQAPAETYGLRLSGGADGLIAYNTIAGNLAGVLCDTGATVTDSVVVSNGGANQISGCSAGSLRNAVMSVDLATYSNGQDPDLTLGTTNNMACCFGRGAADANKTIKDDYHAAMRPAAHGYDVGFMQTP